MIILGIDPGTARTGWGVIKIRNSKLEIRNSQKPELLGYGCIVTSKEDGVGKRLVVLYRELDKVIKTHKPDVAALERLFFGLNSKTAISVGQATGVIILAVTRHKVPIFEYTGLQVKLVVAGHGRADKKLVQKKIRGILGVTKRTVSFTARDHSWDDAADALAIAVYHVLNKNGQKN